MQTRRGSAEGAALVLVMVTLAQAIKGHPRPPNDGPIRDARTGQLKVS